MNGTTMQEIVRAAIPGATEDVCEHVLWGMTPFPMGAITAQSLFRAASRFRRANDNGIRLCDWCDHKAQADKYLCSSCEQALDRARERMAND